MPELPEVETIRRYLDGVLPGQEVLAVPHLDARMVKRSPLDAEAMRAAMVGRRFGPVERRGKFLFLTWDTGASLLLHLGMSGRLVVEAVDAPFRPHTHLIIEVPVGQVRLADPRRFGRLAWVETVGANGLGLGVEPLSRQFTAARLGELLQGRSVAIKSALLNQSLVAGLGNIYADEALFQAGIHPERPAGSLRDEEVNRLARAVRAVLKRSIAHRGTSFSDYVDALGHPGENQAYLRVYGREGQPCLRCRTPIMRRVVGGRSSHYCPRCQPASPMRYQTINARER